jgi:hypothetical protein
MQACGSQQISTLVVLGASFCGTAPLLQSTNRRSDGCANATGWQGGGSETAVFPVLLLDAALPATIIQQICVWVSDFRVGDEVPHTTQIFAPQTSS